MKPFNLRLLLVRADEVRGDSFDIGSVEDPGFQASFSSEIISDIDEIKLDSKFDSKLKITCRPSQDADPFFTMSVIGKFQVVDEESLAMLKEKNAAYQAATHLFPYLRNLCMPILEHLGAADVSFPFFLPPPPPAKPSTATSTPRKRTKAKS